MNPITNQQPPLQVQPPRPSFSCDRHPDDNFTGFCPSCLVERLAILDQSPTAASSSLHTSTRSIFKLPSTSSTSNATRKANRNNLTKETTTIRSHQELRRTKSFSASYNESFGAFASVIEPQRKSCDVRGRNTLWSLFSSEDENKCSDSSTQQHTLASNCAVLQTNMEDEGEYEECKADDDDEIRVSEEQEVRYLNDLENDIIKMEAEIDAIVDNLKSVKAQLDLDEHSKKPSLPKFWSAASVLSKKWQKWRRKQEKNVASRDSVVSSRTLPVGKPISRQCNETQSEIADQRFGRRSCDTETRFSLDAGRIAFDDTRHSLDDPRASWDGYVIGRSFPLLLPRVEDVPAVKVPRADMLIPLEEPAIPVDIPGGSIQTREYYLDSSSKRRKSLDGSTSIRRMAATVVAEMDGQKPSTSAVYNAKVSPATIDFSHIRGRSKFHSIGCEKELGRHSNSNSNSNSVRDGGSETFDKPVKKSRWWSWRHWGFSNRLAADRGSEKEENGELRVRFNRKLGRSNSSVSWRNSSHNMKKPNSIKNGKNQLEGDEFVFERSRSSRYRFHWTPLGGSRRSDSGTGSKKSRVSSNLARNML